MIKYGQVNHGSFQVNLKNVLQGKMDSCERLWQSHANKYFIKFHIKIKQMQLEINY